MVTWADPIPPEDQCPMCDGKGKRGKKICILCNGTGRKNG